jgi:hypothetical protein
MGNRFRILTAALSVALLVIVLIGAYVEVRGYPTAGSSTTGTRKSSPAAGSRTT